MLAQQLGLVNAAPLERSTQPQDHKLVVFVPAESVDTVLKVRSASVVKLCVCMQMQLRKTLGWAHADNKLWPHYGVSTLTNLPRRRQCTAQAPASSANTTAVPSAHLGLAASGAATPATPPLAQQVTAA